MGLVQSKEEDESENLHLNGGAAIQGYESKLTMHIHSPADSSHLQEWSDDLVFAVIWSSGRVQPGRFLLAEKFSNNKKKVFENKAIR